LRENESGILAIIDVGGVEKCICPLAKSEGRYCNEPGLTGQCAQGILVIMKISELLKFEKLINRTILYIL